MLLPPWLDTTMPPADISPLRFCCRYATVTRHAVFAIFSRLRVDATPRYDDVALILLLLICAVYAFSPLLDCCLSRHAHVVDAAMLLCHAMPMLLMPRHASPWRYVTRHALAYTCATTLDAAFSLPLPLLTPRSDAAMRSAASAIDDDATLVTLPLRASAALRTRCYGSIASERHGRCHAYFQLASPAADFATLTLRHFRLRLIITMPLLPRRCRTASRLDFAFSAASLRRYASHSHYATPPDFAFQRYAMHVNNRHNNDNTDHHRTTQVE